jgi:hypothetical protein
VLRRGLWILLVLRYKRKGEEECDSRLMPGDISVRILSFGTNPN